MVIFSIAYYLNIQKLKNRIKIRYVCTIHIKVGFYAFRLPGPVSESKNCKEQKATSDDKHASVRYTHTIVYSLKGSKTYAMRKSDDI